MSLLISIDWDFFVPEDFMRDMGHRESELFLDFLWSTRMHLVGEMVTSGTEATFWDWLGRYFDTGRADMYLSDSHAYATIPAQHADTLILFDAHHDCWDDKNVKPGEYYCHTWARQWLEEDESRSMFWVFPTSEQAEMVSDIPSHIRDRVTLVNHDSGQFGAFDGVGGGEADQLHICRSGCWTAPWLDRAFINFVEASGRDIGDAEVLQEGKWDPTQERWTAEQFNEYKRAGEVMRAQLAKVNDGHQ